MVYLYFKYTQKKKFTNTLIAKEKMISLQTSSNLFEYLEY